MELGCCLAGIVIHLSHVASSLVSRCMAKAWEVRRVLRTPPSFSQNEVPQVKFTNDRKRGAKHSPPAFPNFSEGLPEGNLEVPDRRRSDFVTSLVRFKVFESIFSEALGSTRECPDRCI